MKRRTRLNRLAAQQGKPESKTPPTPFTAVAVLTGSGMSPALAHRVAAQQQRHDVLIELALLTGYSARDPRLNHPTVIDTALRVGAQLVANWIIRMDTEAPHIGGRFG